MLFQNCQNANEQNVVKSSKAPNADNKLVKSILNCQKLVPVCRLQSRGQISADFRTADTPDEEELILTAKNEHMTWCTSRFLTTKNLPEYSSLESPNIPSFAAVNGLLLNDRNPPNRVGFTPIIPFPATEYNTIFTCMKNYQDVLKQKRVPTGALWCDEGVYRIAKELQLIHPNEFRNISLGLGGCQTEKAVLACMGKFLEDVGVDSVFVADEIFGPNFLPL